MMAPMKLQHSVRYDAPVADVYAMLMDPGYREKVAEAQDAESASVTINQGSVTLDLVTPNKGIPGFARAFAGETTRAITTERWEDGTHAAFHVETPGKPTSISGTRRLVADGDGTRDTFDVEVTARVPLIGGKIEKLMAGQFTDGCDREHTVGTAWLAGGR